VPTLCELAGVPLPDPLDGVSLAGLARGDGARRPAAEVLLDRAKGDPDPMAVRTETELLSVTKRGEVSYFDLRADPEAVDENSASHVERVAALREHLQARHLARVHLSRTLRDGEDAVALDEETRAALEALGYLGEMGARRASLRMPKRVQSRRVRGGELVTHGAFLPAGAAESGYCLARDPASASRERDPSILSARRLVMRTFSAPFLSVAALCGLALGAVALPAPGEDKPEPEYPPLATVIDGLDKVVSTADGSAPLYDLYADHKTGKLLGVLSKGYADQLLMIACTVSGGHPEAGVMGPTYYAKWRKIGKQLALVQPDLSVRTAGDKQATDSIDGLYTGRVMLAMPILAMDKGRPVIDIGHMATYKATSFFDPTSPFGYGPTMGALNSSLASLTKAKAFPENVIVEYEAPRETGQLVKVTYSIGKLDGTKGYEPRTADPRVGYFYDWHADYGKPANQDVTERYISRWHLEKADASLPLSPAKQSVVWYIEHTTPIRYRRYVRDGIKMWNEAYAKVGILDAMEVYQQDSASGAHMEKDPEDARYNFFRWNTSDEGYAIGPSRTNPLTGEILDADIVWNQGLTRSVRTMLESLSGDLVQETFHPETLAFLDEHPNWDPRVRSASPERREQMLRQHAMDAASAVDHTLDSAEHPWTRGSNNPTDQACKIGSRLSMDFALAGAAFGAGMLPNYGDGQELDGLPEEFLGAMIRYISAHEVGHTLGLQHNMAASTIHTLDEVNTEGFEGPTIASVMDYVAANIAYEVGEVQGPYATPSVGPYDEWAIRFGYGPADEVDDVLSEVSDPNHIYITQMSMSVGSDPRNMTWDMGDRNLEFCQSRLALVEDLRSKLTDEIVKDGESWALARRRYGSLMGTHLSALFTASNWVGGSYENYDHKGDPNARPPVEDVAAADQRQAMNLIIDHSFRDEAFGLSPELVRHLGKENWWDPEGMDELMEDPNFAVHETAGTFHAIGLTLLMNPTTLRRVYDNEYRTSDASDSLTLAELVTTVRESIWSEYATGAPVSSFRRNLQREHVERLTDLVLLGDASSPSLRTIGALAAHELRTIAELAERGERGADTYTIAHLGDVQARIGKALDAAYVIAR
jgi:hypothetical protein